MNSGLLLFAITIKKDQTTLLKVPLNQDESDKLSRSWGPLQSSFYPDGCNKIGFLPGYTPELEEIFSDKPYNLPNGFLGMDEYDNLDTFVILRTNNNLKGFVASINSEKDGRILLFQRFAKFQIIRPGFSLTDISGTFSVFDKPSVTFRRSLDAIYNTRERELYFRNYHNVKGFLPMKSVFREATEDDVKRMLTGKNLVAEDIESTLNNLDNRMIEQFSLLDQSNVLETRSIGEIKEIARPYKVDIEVIDNKVVLPAKRKAAKDVLMALNDNFYTGPMSGNKFVANSKRIIQE